MNTLKRRQQAWHKNTRKANITHQSLREIPNDLHLLVLIRRCTKTGVLWLWAYLWCLLVRVYDRYGYRHTIGTGMGVRRLQVQVYRWNGKGIRTSIQQKLYCDMYRICISYIWLEFLDTFDHWISIKKLLWLGDGSVVIKEGESEGEDSRQGNSRQLFKNVFTSGGFGNKLHQD